MSCLGAGSCQQAASQLPFRFSPSSSTRAGSVVSRSRGLGLPMCGVLGAGRRASHGWCYWVALLVDVIAPSGRRVVRSRRSRLASELRSAFWRARRVIQAGAMRP